MHLSKVFLAAGVLATAANAWYFETIAENFDARGAFHYDSGNT